MRLDQLLEKSPVLILCFLWALSDADSAEAQDSETACYAITNIDIQDRDEYRRYEAGFGEIFAQYDGTILAVSEEPEVLEGEWPHTRAVLIRFPSREALAAWYDSPEYQTIAKHRFAASKANIILLQGRP